jgi:acyl-CoA thioester hydrolase
MYSNSVQIRVRYAETDKMGFVYHGNYAQYFEVGRVEGLRSLGLSYKKMEEDGILLPVLEFQMKFIKPAFYDDLLNIKTTLKEVNGARVYFEYEIVNELNELISIASTTLVFVSSQNFKPCPAPEWFMEKLKEGKTD